MALIYAAIAVVMTWPLVANLGTRLASDLGDPAFSSWVLAWDAGQLLKALGGDMGALAQYWNGNIFYPEPLALAYSEHMTAQALQILPIYAATGNIFVAYNLLFVSTFALSGLAVYLLVRDLTARPLAAFLAGLAFAYAPYRLGQFSHLHVLSSYWMPFALLGLHRYFARVTAGERLKPRAWALAGAAAALVMQHLSCGYYMLFFAPFVTIYCLYEATQRRLALDWRVWCELGVTAAVVGAATWPFVQPYFVLRELGMVGVRSYAEVVTYSADTHAFATAAGAMRWFGGWTTGYFKAEGEGFPGVTILLFAAMGLVWGCRRIVAGVPWSSIRDWHASAVLVSAVVAAGATGVVLWFFVHGHLMLRLGRRIAVYQQATPALFVALVAGALCLVLVALARRPSGTISREAFGFFVLAAICAALFALGPRIEAGGQRLGPGPYLWLLEYVPGFDGLRVPARLLMLVSLFLAVIAGFGAAALLRTRFKRLATTGVLLGAVGILSEGWVAPLTMNLPVMPAPGLSIPHRPGFGRRLNPIYDVIRELPDPVVLVEFPFGDPAHELLAVLYAGYHRRPLVNGYSGFFPPSYAARASVLGGAPGDPERVAATLAESGATHVLVHEGAFQAGRGRQLSDWLRSQGARPVSASGADTLFALK